MHCVHFIDALRFWNYSQFPLIHLHWNPGGNMSVLGVLGVLSWFVMFVLGMPCSLVRLPWLLALPLAFLILSGVMLLTGIWPFITCIHHWLEAFSAQAEDSALKLRWMDVLKYNVLAVCSELCGSYSWFITPALFLTYQSTVHQFVTHLLMNAPTCLFSIFLDSLFFPRNRYDPLMPFLLFKAVVFFIGNWSKCSLSANILSSVSSHKYFCDRILKNKCSSTLIISSNPLWLCFFLEASKLFPTFSSLFCSFWSINIYQTHKKLPLIL